MKKNKEILSNINKELSQFDTGSFSSIKEKVLSTNKLSLDEVKGEVIEEPKHFNWKLAVAIPVAVIAVGSVPLSIYLVNKPVAPCEASVKTTFSDRENDLSIRYELNNNKVNINSLKGIDNEGRELIKEISKFISSDNVNNLDSFITYTKEYINTNNLLDSDFTISFEVIRQNENFELDSFDNCEISYFLMGNKNDYNNVRKIIDVLDIGNRIFEGSSILNDVDFSYQNLLNYFRSKKDFEEIYSNFNFLDNLINTSEEYDSFTTEFGLNSELTLNDLEKLFEQIKEYLKNKKD